MLIIYVSSSWYDISTWTISMIAIDAIHRWSWSLTISRYFCHRTITIYLYVFSSYLCTILVHKIVEFVLVYRWIYLLDPIGYYNSYKVDIRTLNYKKIIWNCLTLNHPRYIDRHDVYEISRFSLKHRTIVIIEIHQSLWCILTSPRDTIFPTLPGPNCDLWVLYISSS